MYVDNASHIRAHGVNRRVRSKSKVVDTQISGSLVYHVTNYVHLHLNMARKKEQVRNDDEEMNILLKASVQTDHIYIHKLIVSLGYLKCAERVSPHKTSCIVYFHVF